jgi:hypothetical protein
VYEGFRGICFPRTVTLENILTVPKRDLKSHIPDTTSKKPAKPASLFLLVLLEALYSATFRKPKPAKPANQ